jgi:hypothetical protein
MKTMSDHQHNTGNRFFDIGLLGISWVCGFISINVTYIPIILSSLASLLSIYYQYQKNKKQ